jgi:uncharacterized protein YjbJ (UPF0337 family)
MNSLIRKGQWNILKGKSKQLFAGLLNRRMAFIDGKKDEYIGKIQKRVGRAIH